jgi:ABC-type uncharacterized transport system substrate-binding protein
VDVIVATGPALPALKEATSTIPVVMGGDSDPVGRGYVQLLDIRDQIGVALDSHHQDQLAGVPALVGIPQHIQDIAVLDGQYDPLR